MDCAEEEYGVGQPRMAKFRLEYELLDEVGTEPPEGKVLEEDKRTPTEVRPLRELSSSAEPFLFKRGHCDMSPLLTKLAAEGDAVWSETFAERRNVKIARPSHDSWGIRKLAFVFCDDFVHRVYRLPLWLEWLDAIMPILQVLNLHPSRVIRCLLASMPPKTVIPVHQDSGYWVPRTHRIHCAVHTNDNVVFRVGRTPTSMRRFKLKPGSVVELNNQAKHYVANLDPTHYRTHLILDYADDAFPELLPPALPVAELGVGSALVQTRRTIALASERGTGTPAPHFLIIGAQKAGTTSLYEYLAQHPLVIKGKRRETHFLDWRWPFQNKTIAKEQKALRMRWHDTFYDIESHKTHPQLIAGDSTPSYLLASHLAIPRLQAMDFDGPFLVMLRDPVARALSHYAMIVDTNCTPAQRKTRGTEWLNASPAQIANTELQHLIAKGLLRPRATKNNYVPNLTDSFDLDPSKLANVLADLPNSHGSHSLLLRGLYALQLRPWFQAYGIERFLILKCEDMARDPRAIVDRAQRHIGLREHPLDSTKAHNVRSIKPPCDPVFVAQLRTFYAPFDQDLAQLLGWTCTSSVWGND